MFTILLSLGGGFLVGGLISLAFGNWAWGIIPGLIVSIVLLVVIGRRVWAGLQKDMARVETLLKPAGNPKQPTLPPFDKAIETIEDIIRRWKPWVPTLRVQLNGQIGYLYYMQKKWKEAEPLLENSSPRQGLTYAMLAAIQHRRKKNDDVRRTMESVVKHTKKDAFLWNLYAWFLCEQGDRTEAIRVLRRALEQIPSDERTQRNLDALQNNKNLRMKGFDLMWYQFHFETPPPMMMTPSGQVVPAQRAGRGLGRQR